MPAFTPPTLAWTVTARLPGPPDVRRALRHLHHAPFPGVAGLLARRVSATARGVEARYLFDSPQAAAGFRAQRDDQPLTRLGAAVTGPVRAVPDAPLIAPVIIVSPPRSGSTALFDALARHPGLWTVGAESEGVIEGVPALHPAARGYDSHELSESDAETTGTAVRAGFLADLRDARGRSWLDRQAQGIGSPLRLLEKTPENALRLRFLLRLFPDATVIHLRRDPRDTVASMVRAWNHPGFVNIPDLPGWHRGAWHLLLPEGWRGWAGDDLSRIAARQWGAAVDAILDAHSLLPAQRWVEVGYARLTAAPAGTLRQLETALGLPPDARRREIPLSATTISPPRRGKWRATPGFDPAALDEATGTMRRLTNGAATMPATAETARRRPMFACWLGHAATGAGHAEARADVVDPTAVLQAGVTIPLSLARRARFRDRFLAGYPILWVEDPATGALMPFWVRFEDLRALRGLVPGRPAPADLPERLRSKLAASGVLAPAGSREQRVRQAATETAAAAAAFAETDVCQIDAMLPSAQREALLDYYDRLIATGSWPLGDEQVAGRYGWYNESLSRFHHHQYTGMVGRLAGRPVRPSYSYVSAYRGGAVLNRHVDREQCEFTVSLLLGESGPGIGGGWPLHLETRGATISLTQRPGQAILFRGTRVPHHRPPLADGSTHTSLLFHYVPAEFRRTLY